MIALFLLLCFFSLVIRAFYDFYKKRQTKKKFHPFEEEEEDNDLKYMDPMYRYAYECIDDYVRSHCKKVEGCEVAKWEGFNLLNDVIFANLNPNRKCTGENIRVTFTNGVTKDFHVLIEGVRENLSIFDFTDLDEKEKEMSDDLETKLENWLSSWNFARKLEGYIERNEDFKIPTAELPKDRDIIEMILSQIANCGCACKLFNDGIHVTIV